MSLTFQNNKTAPWRPKRRLKKSAKMKLTVIAGAIITAIILFFPIKNKIDKMMHPPSVGSVRVDWYKDYNAVHLLHARRNGTPPFNTNAEFREKIGDLVDDDKLVKISDNSYYRVWDLTHSHPYLTPTAEEFLEDLGKRFREKLDKEGLPDYYFQISSLLRTRENQKSLSRSNINAANVSSHMYGTTFDIPYKTVVKRTFLWNETEITDGTATKLLSAAIGELRKEKRCVVVTERKEACFHITVIN